MKGDKIRWSLELFLVRVQADLQTIIESLQLSQQKTVWLQPVLMPDFLPVQTIQTEKTKMPIPEYFDIRKQIAAEGLSNDEYQIVNAPELAVYHWGFVGGYTSRTIEIWIPIEKK